MRRDCTWARSLAALVVWAGLGLSPSAQTPAAPQPIRRSPAVFGGDRRADASTRSLLTASAQLLGGYDDNATAVGLGGGGGGGLGGAQASSAFGGAALSLSGFQRRQRLTYGGNLSTQYRTFFNLDGFDATTYSGSGQLRYEITRRSSVNVQGLLAVQPFYQYDLVGGLTPFEPDDLAQVGGVFTPDFIVSQDDVLRYSTGAGYRYSFNSRTEFSANATRNGFKPLDEEEGAERFSSLNSTSVGARIRRRLSPNLAVRAGYTYRQFDRQLPSAVDDDADPALLAAANAAHDIDAGIDYQRELPFARRTYVGISTGASVIQGNGAVDDTRTRSRTTVTGNATLRRDFARTWSAQLRYSRGAAYLEGLAIPVVSDTAEARVGGLFTDRLSANVSVSYREGTRAFRTTGGRFRNTNAGAQMQYAVNTNVAAFVAYTYAQFSSPNNAGTSGLFRDFDRQGIRGGMTIWFDLLR